MSPFFVISLLLPFCSQMLCPSYSCAIMTRSTDNLSAFCIFFPLMACCSFFLSIFAEPKKKQMSKPALSPDELYMRRCLQLARQGQLNAKPNPMVGAVIVANDIIIGEGFHIRCGEGHAEVNAFASVNEADKSLLPQSTIYVSLEPCAHYGKTPPCADLIVSKGVKRVVVGCVDEFAKVQGRGIEKLRNAGISVTVGVLENECRLLNRRFFTFHSKHRPYYT